MSGRKSTLLVASVSLLALASVSGCNKNGLAVMPGSLQASPEALDYGLVKENEAFSQTVILTQEGAGSVQVTNFRFDPADAPYRFEEGQTLPTADAPWTVSSAEFRSLNVEFAPVINGVAEANLIIESNDPSNPELVVTLGGHGYHTAVDDFEQGGTLGGKADILFIVDNSGSMSDEQTKLGQSFNTFINWLTGGLVDYHIAITSTDMDATGAQGAFIAAGSNPKILDMNTPDVATVFAQNTALGTGGSADEKGLAAASTAVSPAMLAGANAGFLRTDARLFVVWVTDEDDASSGSAASHKDAIISAKGGNPDDVFFAAIAGPNNLFDFSCLDASPAFRYHEVINQTAGLYGSICAADFGVTLQDLAFEVTASGSTFPLDEIPEITSIQVLVNGIVQPTTAWVYAAVSNTVQFVPAFAPAGGDVVTITYDVL